MDRCIEQYIINHFDDMSCEDLRKQVNAEFGTSYKTTAFHYHTKRLGLSKQICHRYTAEQDAFLKAHAGIMTRQGLTNAFNERYGTRIKYQAIEQRCFMNGWFPPTDGKFKPGGTPWSKTKGGREVYVQTLKGGNSTSFKKGITPHNRRDVGTVSLWGHNLRVKTETGWDNRLRHLWKIHYGEIPDGYVVISVDGDHATDNYSNLRLISEETLRILMANRWTGKGADIVDTGIVWSDLYLTLKLQKD